MAVSRCVPFLCDSKVLPNALCPPRLACIACCICMGFRSTCQIMGRRRTLAHSLTTSPTRRRIRYDWFFGREKSNQLTIRKVWPIFMLLLAVHLMGSFVILFRWRQDVDNQEGVTSPPIYASNGLRILSGSQNLRGVQDLAQLGYPVRPKAVIYNTDHNDDSEMYFTPSLYRIPDDHMVYPTKRDIPIAIEDFERREKVLNSAHYNSSKHAKYKIYDDYPECQPMYDWQTKSFPTCNSVHEVDLTDLSFERNRMHRQIYYKAHGYFRDVFVIRDFNLEKRVLKVLRMWHSFDELNYERHRKDAVAMERLTSSPYIMDIYGFCGQTALFDYGMEGNIDSALWDSEHILSYKERLSAAVEVVEAVSNLHNFFDKGPAITHTDIMTNQFIYTNGRYRLNDFNRCIFMYWNTTSNSSNCPFKFPDENAWIFRSPEEYAYSFQSEKIDVYSMGNVFFTLLEEDFPFHESEEELGVSTIQKWVKEGRRPDFVKNPHIKNITHPAVLAIKQAMHMCWEQDWRKRATAKEVKEYLIKEFERIERGGLEKEWIENVEKKESNTS